MTSMKQRRLLHSPHLTCQRTSRSAQDKLRLAVAVDSHADVSKHGAQRVDMRCTGVGVMWSPELASQVPLLPHDLKGNSEYFGCGCNMMQPFSDACCFDVFQICISVKYHESTCSMLEPFESTRKMLTQTSGTVSESSPQIRVTPNCWVMSRITNSSDFRPFNLGNPESLAMMEEVRIPRLAKGIQKWWNFGEKNRSELWGHDSEIRNSASTLGDHFSRQLQNIRLTLGTWHSQ